MKKDLKAILKQLDRIEENQQGQLQGGFASLGSIGSSSSSFANTNCKGANCVSGCGGNNVQGCEANTVAGCGGNVVPGCGSSQN